MISALCVLLSAALSFSPTPSDRLAAEMILVEVAQDGVMGRSKSPADPGQCRRFQVNSFAAASEDYFLEAYPDAVLFLPDQHAPRDVTGRPVGTCWDMPDASEGNAYMEVARFDYDGESNLNQNKEVARGFLATLRAGDVLQLYATYSSGGRGTHTVLITRPFDPRSGMLYWADSNFANTRIDGVRYGYVRAYQQWPVEEVVTWLTHDMYNGATLYRLRPDISQKAQVP